MTDAVDPKDRPNALGWSHPGTGYGHLALGLGLDHVEPDWAPLSSEDARHVLARYPALGAVRSIVWHSPRPFSAGARVQTDGGEVFVKRVHAAVRSPEDIEPEHAFMAHLAGRGVSVPSVLRDAKGRTAVPHDGWTYEVHRLGSGVDLYRDAPSWTAYQSEAHAAAAGRALAILHRGSVGFDRSARRCRMLRATFDMFGDAEPLARVEAVLIRRPALRQWMEDRPWQKDISARLLIPFHATARGAIRGETPLWTHGDWHGSNLLWYAGEAAQVQTVMDFGLANRTFAIFDIATAIERSLISWLERERGLQPQVNLEQLDAFLRGYAAVVPLDGARLHAIAAVLPLVHADFALSEVDYFVEATGNIEHARIAYDDYLLAHADWFLTAEGQRLQKRLDHLARRGMA